MYKLLQSYSTPGCTIARGTIGEYSSLGGYLFRTLEGNQEFIGEHKVHNTKDWFEKISNPEIKVVNEFNQTSIFINIPCSEELANKLTAAIRSVL